MPISQTEDYFENPQHRFLEESMLFLLETSENELKKLNQINGTSKKMHFPMLIQKPTQILP